MQTYKFVYAWYDIYKADDNRAISKADNLFCYFKLSGAML